MRSGASHRVADECEIVFGDLDQAAPELVAPMRIAGQLKGSAKVGKWSIFRTRGDPRPEDVFVATTSSPAPPAASPTSPKVAPDNRMPWPPRPAGGHAVSATSLICTNQ